MPNEIITMVETTNTIVVKESEIQVVEIVSRGPQGAQGAQGPQGPQGQPGPSVDPALYFQVANRFYEISSDENAKSTARQNLGVAIVDGGTFN